MTVPFAVGGACPGAGGPFLPSQWVFGDRAEVFQGRGWRAGGGMVAEVDGPLIHESGEFAEVAIGLRITSWWRALGVGGRAGNVAVG